MLFPEAWIERVLNKEGQIITDVKELDFPIDKFIRYVFKPALERLHRARPIIVNRDVMGPRWDKTPDCQQVVRVTSNFLLTSSGAMASVYTGKEVRQIFEESENAIWIPHGLSKIFYIKKFEYLFDREVIKYPICTYDIYPNVEYDFLLPFTPLGKVRIGTDIKRVINGELKEVPESDFVVRQDREEPKKIYVTYVPSDGYDKPLSVKHGYIKHTVYDWSFQDEIQKQTHAWNNLYGTYIDSGPVYANGPTIYCSTQSKYEYCSADDTDWRDSQELVELYMTVYILRALANKKAVLSIGGVEFDPNKDDLINRAKMLEDQADNMSKEVNKWWEW